MLFMRIVWISLAFILLAPVAGGLLAGLDRIVSARMQGRKGPSIFQSFYDVLKLFQKDNPVVTPSQNFYITCFLIFMIFTGILFFTGQDLLLTVFSSTLAGIFFVLAGYSTYSPYSFIGSERELIAMMSYEPMVILSAIGMYMVTGSFAIGDIIAFPHPVAFSIPCVFLGYLFILTIRMRKSPFDVSMSHHAHQEVVSGITTEFTGKTLAMIELGHWYENIFLLGTVYLFFASNPVLGIFMALAVYFLEIFIDNTNARVKWPVIFKSSWLIAVILGGLNVLILFLSNLK